MAVNVIDRDDEIELINFEVDTSAEREKQEDAPVACCVSDDEEICCGVVKRFDSTKGFGFITPNDGSGSTLFVHYSEIYAAQGFKSLNEGERVEFEVVIQDDGRRKAINVTGPFRGYVKGSNPNLQVRNKHNKGTSNAVRGRGGFNNYRRGHGPARTYGGGGRG
eukprot:CAMPEP_0201573332 /NCGR_PEP_ID=MMETSP0190_2-20130828/17135_1 /ASSEMBLY_ACC=CAM_ASM_000263 /TAXON_ID=37353 /ORGANISM="Rosalina sp." /LENGTH=163 /DNA_ID=CAMNT_0048000177 /DNA_START=232 /DNA_END=719 /DNA_ORIENTATION=+